MPTTVKALDGWQYVNGRRIAVRRTDAGFLVSRAATGRQVAVAMICLLTPSPAPVLANPCITPFTSSMTFPTLPLFNNELLPGAEPTRET